MLRLKAMNGNTSAGFLLAKAGMDVMASPKRPIVERALREIKGLGFCVTIVPFDMFMDRVSISWADPKTVKRSHPYSRKF